MRNYLVTFICFLTLTIGIQAQNNEPEFERPIHLLVFTKTAGYRHESISSGLKMLYDLSEKQNWIITATENDKLLRDDLLSNFDVAVFLSPSDSAIDDAGKEAFEKWMNSGKGFVGIHAASTLEYDWAYYGKLIGAYFKNHPPAQESTVVFENTDHPAMKPFKGMESHTFYDEWYTFKENPRPHVDVLATLDESSIKKFSNDDFRMGDHPIIWSQQKNDIRSFYTGFGHTHEAFQDKLIVEHIKNAINWAAKRID
ncbi:MAG TPA: ThuA domain-containing protein [Dysgonamonadaceae bacterium]|nr:ThuA domain-containing protein [Dysgonamonadaceae bacterium]